MMKAGFQLDAKAYNILIGGFSRRKRLQRLISGLVCTYNTLLSALCKVGHFSAVDELLGKMMVVRPSEVTFGTQPNTVIYDTLIDFVCRRLLKGFEDKNILEKGF
ncbi:hypothetical protein ACQJBY_052466 [Aegilops geniculata]